MSLYDALTGKEEHMNERGGIKMDLTEKMLLLDKVKRYTTQEKYLTDENITLEEFKELLEFGDVQDLTLGTYNGATEEFMPCSLTTDNIVRAMTQYIHETELYELYDCFDIGDFEELTLIEQLEEFTSMYDVFTIGNNIYADIR